MDNVSSERCGKEENLHLTAAEQLLSLSAGVGLEKALQTHTELEKKSETLELLQNTKDLRSFRMNERLKTIVSEVLDINPDDGLLDLSIKTKDKSLSNSNASASAISAATNTNNYNKNGTGNQSEVNKLADYSTNANSTLSKIKFSKIEVQKLKNLIVQPNGKVPQKELIDISRKLRGVSDPMDEKISIKHKLPLIAPPEREKYKIMKTNAAVGEITSKTNEKRVEKCSVETQTDKVFTVTGDQYAMLQFIISSNLTMASLSSLVDKSSEDINNNRQNDSAQTATIIDLDKIDESVETAVDTESLALKESENNKALIFKVCSSLTKATGKDSRIEDKLDTILAKVEQNYNQVKSLHNAKDHNEKHDKGTQTELTTVKKVTFAEHVIKENMGQIQKSLKEKTAIQTGAKKQKTQQRLSKDAGPSQESYAAYFNQHREHPAPLNTFKQSMPNINAQNQILMNQQRMQPMQIRPQTSNQQNYYRQNENHLQTTDPAHYYGNEHHWAAHEQASHWLQQQQEYQLQVQMQQATTASFHDNIDMQKNSLNGENIYPNSAWSK